MKARGQLGDAVHSGHAVGAARIDQNDIANIGFQQALEVFPGSPCSYAGPWERAGLYDVTVTKSGYADAVQRAVRVTADECHVQTVVLTIRLSPR